MSKCFTCEYLKSDSIECAYKCTMDCLDCKYNRTNSKDEPCINCNFGDKCLFEKK